MAKKPSMIAMSDTSADKLAACLNYSAAPADRSHHSHFDARARWFGSLSPDDKETVLTVVDCIATAHKDIAESIAATLPPATKFPLP